ncbi:MAG: hypothetical protein NDI63_10215 [Pseudobdellovibrio sp.]|nr:hypothetical protein [Pseudobdellovibrio sp.]
MLFLFKSILLISDKEDYPNAVSQMPGEWEKAAEEINDTAKYKGEVTFIIGPWGSGKSTFLSTLLEQKKTKYKNIKQTRRITLNTASNLDEVFSQFVPVWIKVFYLIVTVLLIGISLFYVSWDTIAESTLKSHPALTIFAGLFAVFFLTNKFRLFYIFSSGLDLITGTKLVIIEDFDRGSLSHGEIYNSMMFRFKMITSYVVALGYSSEEQKNSYVETALKLNAKIILFNLSENSLYGILTSFYSNPPMNAGAWILNFPARKIISIIARINKHSIGKNDAEKIHIFLKIWFDELVEAIKLQDAGKLAFSDNGRYITSHSYHESNQRDAIYSFLRSIDHAKIAAAGISFGSSANAGSVYMHDWLVQGKYTNGLIGRVELI